MFILFYSTSNYRIRKKLIDLHFIDLDVERGLDVEGGGVIMVVRRKVLSPTRALLNPVTLRSPGKAVKGKSGIFTCPSLGPKRPAQTPSFPGERNVRQFKRETSWDLTPFVPSPISRQVIIIISRVYSCIV
jgi:hypothetical protein